MALISPNKSQYGLQGGTFLTGSASVSGSGNYFFCYLPITASIATIFFTNIASGNSVLNNFPAGIPIYGQISAVSQSAGAAFVYNCIKDSND